RDVPAELLAGDAGTRLAPERIMPELQRPANARIPGLLEGPFANGAALVIDGTWELGEGDAHALALATDEALAVIDLPALDDHAERALATWLGAPGIAKTAYDTKLAGHQLGGRGLPPAGGRTDLAIAEFLCRPDQRPTDLAGL